jgi:hypothetical protein
MRLIALLLLLPLASAAVVDVTVSDFINADVIGLKYENISQKPIKVSFEAFNSGSVGCNAMIRMDISRNGYTFTAWSRQFTFQPNDRESIELYWFPHNLTGNFSGIIRYYCANEIKEIKNFSVEVKDYISKEPSIEIISPKIFEKKITFNLRSNSTEDVIVIPADYPKGWSIQQKKVHLEKGKIKYVELDYSKDIWKLGKLTIIIASDAEYGMKTIDIKKEPGLNELVFETIDFIETVLSKIL